MEKSKNCPCKSGKTYSECCQKYHQGIPAENALVLMRSRYSAYALNLPAYIIKTTHPLNPQFKQDTTKWAEEIRQFSQSTDFKGLTIIDFQELSNHEATVTFIASLQQGGKDASFQEKSLFEKIDENWLYKDGQFNSIN